MSDPVVIATIAAAGLKSAGTIAQGRNTAKRAKLQAEMTRRQAERVRTEAQANADRLRRKASRESGSLRARLLASGVSTKSGSALLSLETLAGEAELDALTELNAGAFRSGQLEAEAALTSFRGRAAKREALTSAGSSLLKSTAPFLK